MRVFHRRGMREKETFGVKMAAAFSDFNSKPVGTKCQPSKFMQLGHYGKELGNICRNNEFIMNSFLSKIVTMDMTLMPDFQ